MKGNERKIGVRYGIRENKLLIITMVLSALLIIQVPLFADEQTQGAHDISVEEVTLSRENPTVGEEVLLTTTLKNNGKYIEQIGKVVVAFDDVTNVISVNEFVDVLMPGEEVLKLIKVETPYYDERSDMIVIVDPDNEIYEADESNNEFVVNCVYPVIDVVKHTSVNNKDEDKYDVDFTLRNDGDISVNSLNIEISQMDQYGFTELIKNHIVILESPLVSKATVEVKCFIDNDKVLDDKQSFFFKVYPNAEDAVDTVAFVHSLAKEKLSLSSYEFSEGENGLSCGLEFDEKIKLKNTLQKVYLVGKGEEQIELSPKIEGNVLNLTTNEIKSIAVDEEYIVELSTGYVASIDGKTKNSREEIIYIKCEEKEDALVVTMSEQEIEEMKSQLLALEKQSAVTIEEEATPLGRKLRFKDIGKSWALPYIEKLANDNIVSGYEDGTFKPDEYVTRGEFIKMLVISLRYDIKQGKEFADTSDFWGVNYIATAYKYGLIKGNDDGLFRPGDNITREEMAVIVARALKLVGINGKVQTFKDEEMFSDWSVGYIYSVYQEGVINGYEDETFRPKGKLTRGEASKVIYETIDRIH